MISKVRYGTEQTVKDCKDYAGKLATHKRKIMKIVNRFDLVVEQIYIIIYNEMFVIVIKTIGFIKIFHYEHVINILFVKYRYCILCKPNS